MNRRGTDRLLKQVKVKDVALRPKRTQRKVSSSTTQTELSGVYLSHLEQIASFYANNVQEINTIRQTTAARYMNVTAKIHAAKARQFDRDVNGASQRCSSSSRPLSPSTIIIDQLPGGPFLDTLSSGTLPDVPKTFWTPSHLFINPYEGLT